MIRATTLFALTLAGCSDYNLSSKGDEAPPLEEEEPIPGEPAPDIEVTPNTLDFGYLPADCASEGHEVTITNVGDADLDITNIELVGSSIDQFHHNGQSLLLAPGESDTFSVWFMAAENIRYDDVDVIITSNDPDEPEALVPLLGNGADDALIEEIWEQEPAEIVDVLWIIDNSGSMSSEVNALASNFQTFMQIFVNQGLDFQIAVITTDMDDPSQSGAFRGPVITPSTPDPVTEFTVQAAQGSSGSADERALDAAHAALTDTSLLSGVNAGFPRTDANLAMIVVSDEDDSSSISVPAFVQWLDNIQGNPSLSSFSAIAGPEQSGFIPFPCVTFTTGTSATSTRRYPDVIRATGGIHANICQMDFTSVMQYLSAVAAGLTTRWELGYVPTSAPTVMINGQVVPYDDVHGWSYDQSTNEIVFNGAAIPQPGDVVTIEYPIETECP